MLFVIFCVILDVVLGGCGTLCAFCVAVTAWLSLSLCLHVQGVLAVALLPTDDCYLHLCIVFAKTGTPSKFMFAHTSLCI